jgi:organic radical activating enzyme
MISTKYSTKSLEIKNLEFYITNVCNLACEGCNRFNNYKFTGFQRWKDYQPVYSQWAEQLEINGHIGILGGEPLLNPDIMAWIDGLHTLWPTTKLNVITNAYQLNKVPGLYDYLLSHRKCNIKVGIHNKKYKKFIMQEIEKFLTGPFTYKFDTSDPYDQKLTITDSNHISILIEYNWWFHQGSLIKNPDTNNFILHQSDVKKAHDNCSMKYCHTMFKGKMYKCGVVALLPEFSQQHKFSLSDSDHALMHGYSPLCIEDTIEQKLKFTNHLPDAIDQCKFCPEVYHGDQIWAEEKKLIWKK